MGAGQNFPRAADFFAPECSLSLLLSYALKLLLHIAPQPTDGIGATLPAVLHLLDDLPQLLLDLSLLLRRGGLDVGEFVLGNEGHDIMDIDPHGLDLASDVEDVLVVDPRYEDRIDLHDLL